MLEKYLTIGYKLENIKDNKYNNLDDKNLYIIDKKLPRYLDNEFEDIIKGFIKIGPTNYGVDFDDLPLPLSPEELEKQEKERSLAQRRNELERRFEVQVPYDLTEEEIEKISNEQVESLAGKWFLFLRGRGIKIEFPESMNGQFSSMIDAFARRYVEQQYGVSTQLPLDRLLDVTKLELNGCLTGRVIQIAEGQEIQKNFPLGRIYETFLISGLRKRVSPLEATALLVYGLIGKKNVNVAYQAFEKGKLESARKDLQSSHLSREKIFREMAPYLAQLSQGDIIAAEQILRYFVESIQTEQVSDLVEGVRGLFRKDEGFSHLDIKMQDGVYKDLFDNSRLMSCTFLPRGSYKEAVMAYHTDPDVGLLHTSPRSIDKRLDPIGVSILLNATDENGRKWLIVDSVEGGRDLDRIKDKLWIPAVYNGIVGVAKDIDAFNVLFSSRVYNGRPKHFINYISKRHLCIAVNLKKSGMSDYSYLGISSSASKEAFETWGEGRREGEAKGYVLEIQK